MWSTAGHLGDLAPSRVIIHKSANAETQVSSALHEFITSRLAQIVLQAHICSITCMTSRELMQTAMSGEFYFLDWIIEGTLCSSALAAKLRPHVLPKGLPPTDKDIIGPTPAKQQGRHSQLSAQGHHSWCQPNVT
jgi:hypothetical protein